MVSEEQQSPEYTMSTAEDMPRGESAALKGGMVALRLHKYTDC